MLMWVWAVLVKAASVALIYVRINRNAANEPGRN